MLGSKIGSSCGNKEGDVPATTPTIGRANPPPEGYERTVVFMYKTTIPGEFVFLKGGKVKGNNILWSTSYQVSNISIIFFGLREAKRPF